MTYPPPQRPHAGPPHGYPPPGWQYPGAYGPPPPRRRTGLVVAIVAVVVLVAGALAITGFVAPGFFLADEEAAGPPTQAPPPVISTSPSTATGETLPHSGAPKVQTPIADTSRWEADPCSLISKAQFAAVKFRPQETEADTSGSPDCVWQSMADGLIDVRVTGTLGANIPDGLSGLYAQQSIFRLFEEIEPIHGHPAVLADLTDRRREGDCAVMVGLSDALAYRTIVDAKPDNPQGQDPCKVAVELAGSAVQNMQRGS